MTTQVPLARSEFEQRRRALIESLRAQGLDEETLRIAMQALDAPAPEVATEPPAPPLPVSEVTMHAAIAHTFVVASPGTSNVREFDTIIVPESAEREALLANSRIIMLGGRNRLQLTDEARADLLNRVHTSKPFIDLLEALADADRHAFSRITNDPVALPAAWLRSFLVGEHGDLRTAPSSEMRAAVEALERLQLAKLTNVTLPPLDEARRLLEWSELLEPLCVLIGHKGGWEGQPPTDRFIGREPQLRQLRGFVDELSSKGTLEAFGRLASRGLRAAQRLFGVRDESVRFLVARGGLGKSALMAKFVLDHALAEGRAFPFVYFDFDRPVLNAREPRQLLIEMARQVGLQFPALDARLRALRQRLGNAIVSREPADGEHDPFDEFRDLVRGEITHGSRAFLVVLDTMEVVQYDPLAIKGIVEFVSRLDGNVYGEKFDELRIVAAGRADIPELRTQAELRDSSHRIVLPPFERHDAVRMANRLGRSLLEQEWNDEWGRAIVGGGDQPGRREPLSIRVCVELVQSAEPEDRQAIVDEIAARGEEAGGDTFVAKLYQVRILRHVRNEYAAKLAWPGLVVRHVNRDLAHAIATLCGLEDRRVDAAFDSLGKEVWMVQRMGDELWHRPDLRARTLPLMRRHKPDLFKKVNALAKDYYAARKQEPGAYAEWLYYRLLAGEDPQSVDADWRDELATHLAGAADDFDPNSPQRAYLLSRTATRLLPPEQIRKLPAPLALDHLARAAEQLGSFDDVKVEPVLADVSVRAAKAGVTSSRPHPVRDVVLIKTGHWRFDAPSDATAGAWSAHSEFAQRFKRARTISDTDESSAGMLLGWASEDAPLRTLVQDLAYARLRKLPMAFELDARLANRLSSGADSLPGHSDLAALRLAAVFTREALTEAASGWLTCNAAVRWTTSLPTISLEELRALFQGGKRVREIIRDALAKVLPDFGLRRRDLLRLVRDSLAQPMVLAHANVSVLLRESIQYLCVQGSVEAQQSLRFFFAARDDDWIVPMGYAAARIRRSKEITGALKARFESHPPATGHGLFGKNLRPGFMDDPLQLLRAADDAADLLGIAHIYEDMEESDADDLRTLLTHHASWSERIQEMLDAGDAWTESATASDPPRPPTQVLHKDDCQKDRWGGTNEREGRRLVATLGDVEEDDFDASFIVESTDGSPLEGPVIFHLHDTYPRQKIWIRKIRDGRRAMLEEVNSYGVYTVGAQVKTRQGRWTSLELDLAKLPSLPRRFLER